MLNQAVKIYLATLLHFSHNTENTVDFIYYDTFAIVILLGDKFQVQLEIALKTVNVKENNNAHYRAQLRRKLELLVKITIVNVALLTQSRLYSLRFCIFEQNKSVRRCESCFHNSADASEILKITDLHICASRKCQRREQC